MIAEALQTLFGWGEKAASPKFLVHEGIPDLVFLHEPSGVISRHEVPPARRKHSIGGFDDLIAFLMDTDVSDNPEVYVQADKVVAFLDRHDRRDYITVSLVETNRFKLVQALATPKQMSPRDAVKMLRFDLHGGNVGHVIQALSRIDFTRTNTGKTDVKHGRETLGQSVEALVQGIDDVPESFVLAVPIWATNGFTRFNVQVQFGVYLDVQNQCVELRVLADEVSRVRNLAVSDVAAELREKLKDVQVFVGTP